MADIKQIKIGDNTYNIKDVTARNVTSKIKWGTRVVAVGSTYRTISPAISYGVTYTNLPYIFLSFGMATWDANDNYMADNTMNAEAYAGLSIWASSVSKTSFKISIWNRYSTSGQQYRIFWLSIGT